MTIYKGTRAQIRLDLVRGLTHSPSSLQALGGWVGSERYWWMGWPVYKERPVGQRVDPLANNVIGGWIITLLVADFLHLICTSPKLVWVFESLGFKYTNGFSRLWASISFSFRMHKASGALEAVTRGSRWKQSSGSSKRSLHVRKGCSFDWYVPGRHLLDGVQSRILIFHEYIQALG